MKRFVAIRSVGASAARGTVEGTIHQTVDFLALKDLDAIPREPTEFARWLDTATNELLARLPTSIPPKADRKRDPVIPKWGHARKFVNLFLRDCLYNYYTREAMGLADLEPLLEVPLDGRVAKGLKAEAEEWQIDASLPVWLGILQLQEEESRRYQLAADRVAARCDVSRVSLDLRYWLRDSQSRR